MEKVVIMIIWFCEYKRSGIGINKTISISNTMKITARRKKRVENGMRADLIGSNPHSNGDDFSRSLKLRMNKIFAIIRISSGIIMHIEEEIYNIFI